MIRIYALPVTEQHQAEISTLQFSDVSISVCAGCTVFRFEVCLLIS